jgi:hypothetical protein
MGKGKKKSEGNAGDELTGQEMLMRITDGYIADAKGEQRRLIYECAMRIPATPKPDEPIYPGDESGASE